MLDDESLLHLEGAFFEWHKRARADQLLPGGDWTTFVLCGGRGSGKTRAGAEAVRQWIREGFNYVNLIGPTAADVRDTMVEGESGILAICPSHERPEYSPSTRTLRWPNGARSLLFSSEEPERLRGPQHQKLWCDELMAWQKPAAALDMARFGLRIGSRPQMIVTTTPKPSKLLRELKAEKNSVWRTVTTYANRGNLAPAFFSEIIRKYENTRLGRQELLAEILTDNPGALWNQGTIDSNRLDDVPELRRIVVAIDPAATNTVESCETGIVIAGSDRQRPAPHFYVLNDLTLRGSPDTWARRAVAAYREYRADRIIGESNNGGDMIESVIRSVDPNVAYSKVTASRGKQLRAEPIAALYEQNRVHHVRTFQELETQLCEWNPATSDSPDRLDAAVWALTELSESYAEPGVVGFWRAQSEADHKTKAGTALPQNSLGTGSCPGNPSTGAHERGDDLKCKHCHRDWASLPAPGCSTKGIPCTAVV